MSWVLKKRKDGKFGWWTTVADGWMTEPAFLSRDDMVEMIIDLKRKHFNADMKELRKTFPRGWFDKDTHKQFK